MSWKLHYLTTNRFLLMLLGR